MSETVSTSEIDPLVLTLGQLLGVVAVESDEVTLQSEWFANPLEATRSSMKNNPDALVQLLLQLLGQVGGNALGVPIDEPSLLGTWYPLNVSSAVSGLYLVTYPAPEGEDVEVIGVGTQVGWTFPAAAGADAGADAGDGADDGDGTVAEATVGPDVITVQAWGMVPLVELGLGAFDLALGAAGRPIIVGVSVAGADGQKLFEGVDIELAGATVSGALDMAGGSAPVSLSLVLTGLKRPDASAPEDISLVDLAALSGDEILSTVAALAMTALAQLGVASDKLAYVLPVLGLAGAVPGAAGTVPALGWVEMAQAAANGGNPAAPLLTWFTQLLDDPTAGEAWLMALGELIGTTGPSVTGSGTRTDPYAVALAVIGGVGSLSVTLGTETSGDGARQFYPGLTFAGEAVSLGDPYVLVMSAALELGQVNLSSNLDGGTVTAAPDSLRGRAGFVLRNADSAQLLYSTASPIAFSLGRVEAGVALAAGMQLQPAFQMVDVTTDEGEYDVLDLLQPAEVARVAMDELTGAIVSTLEDMLGISSGSDAFGTAVGVLVGLIPPVLPGGVTWPATPPLSAQGILAAVKDPIGALTGYFYSLLTTNAGDVPAFVYLVEALGTLLGENGAPASSLASGVTGTGTEADPWRLALGASPVGLIAFFSPPAGAGEPVVLTLGIAANPDITIASAPRMVLDLTVLAVQLGIAPGGSKADVELPAVSAWLPRIQAGLSLPEPLSTPPVLGASVQVASASVHVQWGPPSSATPGWSWDMVVAQPAMAIGSDPPMVLQDELVFSDDDQLAALVNEAGATFAPILVRVLGLFVARTGLPAALALDGVLGLLPDLQDYLPGDLNWPTTMPVFTPTGFDNPVGEMQAQLIAVTGAPDNLRAATTAIAWALTGGGAVPELTGAGSADDPLRLPLGFASGFDVRVWSGAGGGLGVGLGRAGEYAPIAGVQVDTDAYVLAVELPLGGAGGTPVVPVPALALSVQVTSTDGPITTYDSPGGTVDVTGLAAAVQFTLDDGFTIRPIVQLVTSDGLMPLPSSDAQQAFFAALNQAFQYAVVKLQGDATFDATYGLLAELGLLLTDPPGISSAGWNALFANPLSFLTSGITAVLRQTDARAALYDVLGKLLGLAGLAAGADITPATVDLTPVLETLAALGLACAADLGYAPRPEALVQLAQAPVATLTTAVENLLGDPVARQALVTAIAGSSSGAFGPFTWAVTSGSVIEVGVPATAPVAIGSLADVSAQFVVDLQNGALAVNARVYAPQIRAALEPAVAWQLSGQAGDALRVNLAWGDDSGPAAPLLTLYPFSQEVFLEQVIALGPTQAISSFVSLILDTYVLTPYPLVQVLLEALGLVVPAVLDETRQVQVPATIKSLLGLFSDPVGWLLSGGVLGTDGTLDIAKVGALLAQLPPVQSDNGIAVGPADAPDGGTAVAVTGLPYDVVLRFAVDVDATRFAVEVDVTQAVAGGVATVTLATGVTLDSRFQPGVAGALNVTHDSTQVFVTAGYDDGFMLSLGQTDRVNLDLVPFGGWQSLVQAGAAVAVQLLIQELMGYLTDGLAGTSASDFAERLRAAGGPDQLDVGSLVTALSTATDPDAILAAALDWLGVRLSADGAPGTAQAVVTLLTGYVPGTVAVETGLIRWTPSDTFPVSVLTGRDDGGLFGLWTEVNVPGTGLLQLSVARTGVGVDPAAGNAVSFQMGMDAMVPVVSATSGPALSLLVDPTTGAFTMTFDPERADGVASPLQVELLPTFFDGVTVGDWLQQVLLWVAPRFASLMLFNLTQVESWLDTPMVSVPNAPTPAALLLGGGLIEQASAPSTTTAKYVLQSMTVLKQLSPASFVGGLLSSLLASDIELLPIGQGGIYFEFNESLGFGLRVQIPGIQVPMLPNVTFQLGALDAGWIEESGGPVGLTPGLGVYVPIDQGVPDFVATSLVLANVGLDIHGKNQAPLIQVSGFQLGEISPRGLLDLTFSAPGDMAFGGSIGFKSLGIGLSPTSLDEGSDVNPVAANLLGTGSDGEGGTSEPANPTFSAIAGYTSPPGSFWAYLMDSSGAQTDEVIIPIQESFGPLNVEQLALGWDDASLILRAGFTGGLAISGLSATVFDLSVGVKVDDPLNPASYDLDMEGLTIALTAGPVSIGGGMVKEGSGADVIYNGTMEITVSRLSISAVGSYGTVDGEPSFFVFAATGFPLGGPPAFIVKGLAGGLAYNRTLILPQPDEVQDYILVQAASDPDAIFGPDPTAMDALDQLSSVVTPEVGAYWLAAGVHFTSFSLLDSTALVVMEFGNTLAFSVIGLSTLSLPPLVEDMNQALVFIQLGLVVTVNITDGFLSAQAEITPNSFVLDHNCKITGGFAFIVWWSPNEHSGDFVLTLGGYHPNYDPPDYYPAVPRLGLYWSLGSTISITGEAYFALTPNAIMAGGLLDLEFSAGPLGAWFTASADFLIEWKPFYFDVSISISVGVGFTTKMFGCTVTIKAEVGASLQLWGPPTAGKVRVNWYIISFTIPIGNQDKSLDSVALGSWAEFAESFLPPDSVPDSGSADGASGAYADDGQQEVLKLQIPSGLMRGEVATSVWTMRRIGFELRADSAVPTTRASAGDLTPIDSHAVLGVRPMDVSEITSELTFELSAGGQPFEINAESFDITGYDENAPMGLWSALPLDNTVAPATETSIPGVMMSASISGVRFDDIGALGPADVSVFDSESISDMDLPLSLDSPYVPAEPLDQSATIGTVMDTVMAADVVATRNAILQALRDRSLVAPSDPDLNVMASQATSIFQMPPILARLSQTLAPAPGTSTATSTAVKAATVAPGSARPRAGDDPRVAAPRCLGGARRYAGQLRAPGTGRVASRTVRATWVRAGALGVYTGPETGSETGPTLRRGTVAVWSVDARGRHEVRHDGDLGARVVGFDARLEPTLVRQINSQTDGDTPAVTLPAGLSHVVVSGAADARPPVAGWQRGSALVRVNARYLLGDNCLVKPQAVLRDPALGMRGVCAADRMLAGNQLSNGAGRRSGWITTWLPGHHTRAWVLVRGDGAGVRCAVITRGDVGRPVRTDLTPIETRAHGQGVALVLDLQGAEFDRWVRVMVRADDPGQIGGVVGGVIAFDAGEQRPSLGADAFQMADRERATVALSLIEEAGDVVDVGDAA